jgi:GH15 family glucan-1,4-alpha-glucosidase
MIKRDRPSLNLGVIGNCTVSALIDPLGTVVWSCFPRPDGDPVFCRLLNDRKDVADGDQSGLFAIDLINQRHAEQSYLPNTAILVTTLHDDNNAVVQITDFAPRISHYNRLYRPPMLIRRLDVLHGRPRLRIRLRPRFDYGEVTPQTTRGSNHIRYVSPSQTLRLTTDLPVSYVLEERPFLLDRPVNLLLGSDEALMAEIEGTVRDFYERTLDHWHGWVRELSIPFEWQEAVIRAAITLKLCNFEETGAIVAALTTSIPEAPDTQRNWDYRYCWLRDAYLVIHALNRLGGTRTMEGYLSFISNVVADSREEGLRPVYGITRDADFDEREAAALAGYRGMGPVRVGNQAHRQVQNDVYGSVVLAATHVFVDKRMIRRGNDHLFNRLERLGEKAVSIFDQEDAGPWELRTKAKVHTFSSVVCWAACDRLAKIAEHINLPHRSEVWRRHADELHAVISRRAWNPRLNSFVASFDGDELDATLLLLAEFGFLARDDERFAATVEAVGARLRCGDFLFRYDGEDDFGVPRTAFIICVFWYIDALASLGRRDEARAMFETVLARRNPLGLLSEDIDPHTGELWGNFPQTYSMVGLINSAMRLSRSWEEAF